ncbi:eat-18 [Bugula neritina]|uniref:Eat-18 n=1 Tax=Bugula neritina TaxID=10212 RepID=A0A7J7IX05_BUGNE|nr:eat-18 [Bugula neritina]
MIPQQGNTTLDIQMGKYCGTAYPGPIVSEWLTERMILTFSSNSAVTERGFKAKYEFISTLQRFQYCGGNITEGGSGEITPPNYPLKYNTKTVCDWYIYRRNPRAQIKIKFEHFDIEGTMEEAPKQHIISQNGFIRIKYISPSKTYGKTGFKVTWTEVIQEVDSCPWHVCADALLCIPDTAVCNSKEDCFDGSDEFTCATKLSNMSILYIIMGVVILLLVIVLAIICVCVRCSVKKSASRRNSSRKSSSKPSDIQLPMIESDIVYNDRLSKTPMLPKSVSINSSTFSPYDPMLQDGIYKGQQLAPVPDNVFEQSTLSSKYSYNPSLHTSLHRPQSDKYFSSPTHQKYDMDSCLTSL